MIEYGMSLYFNMPTVYNCKYIIYFIIACVYSVNDLLCNFSLQLENLDLDSSIDAIVTDFYYLAK